MGVTSCLLVTCVAAVSAHGSGAWRDPNHVSLISPLAGMRYISEGPPHHLKMVGTDDGKNWWSLSGTCSSSPAGPMTLIHFDFSPKGGPQDLTGVWQKFHDGRVTITWPAATSAAAASAWTQIGQSSDVAFGSFSDLAASPPARRAVRNFAPVAIGAAVLLAMGLVHQTASRKIRSQQQPSVQSKDAATLELLA